MELSPPLTHAESDYLNSEENKVLVDRFRTGIFAEEHLDLADTILSPNPPREGVGLAS